MLVDKLTVSGNQRTKSFVLLREVPFKIGDSIKVAEIESLKKEAIRNITNTGLTNFVEVEFITSDSLTTQCAIKVLERWHIWPNILFSLAETNINSWWENKDFERVNYGFSIDDYNFRGRKEKLSINFQNGWKRKIGLNYNIPGLNKSRTLGGGLELYYANNREVNHQIKFDTEEFNRRDFLKTKRFIQEEIVTKIKLEYRPKYLNTHRWTVGMETIIIDDTVKLVNPNYLANGNTRSQFLYLGYGFRREMRDNRAYPLSGYIIDGSLDQSGLGILNKNDVKLTEAKITINMHHPIQGRWFFGHGLKAKTTLLGKPPYYFQRGLGYGNNYIRGYELYVIDGQHFLLYKSNLKFQVIRKQTIDLQTLFQRFDKFHYSLYVNVFGDAGYVIDQINAAVNPLANTMQYAYGIGIDFVSYYDFVLRLEGSINALGQPGFYINFRNPI